MNTENTENTEIYLSSIIEQRQKLKKANYNLNYLKKMQSKLKIIKLN